MTAVKTAEENKDQLFIRIKGLPIIEFDRNLLAEDVFDVDFGGDYKIQITNENGTFVITNAMNGYGHNCYEQFKGEPVSFMSYYDYALSISNQNAQPIAQQLQQQSENDWEFNEEQQNYRWDVMDKEMKSQQQADMEETLSDLFDKYSDNGSITKPWFDRLVFDFIQSL